MNRELENFRLLVFLSAAFMAAAVGISFLPMPLTEPQIKTLGMSGEGALVSAEVVVLLSWTWLFFYAIAHVMAFFYIWFSRYLFLGCMGITIASAALGGILVSSPWDGTLWAIQNILATFVIGMLFFSPSVRGRTDDNLIETLTSQPHSGHETPIGLPPTSL